MRIVPSMIAFGATIASIQANSNVPNNTKHSIVQGLGNGSPRIEEIPHQRSSSVSPPISWLPQINFGDNPPRELSVTKNQTRRVVTFGHSQQYFPNLLRQYAHEHNISFNEHATEDELILSIQENVPEGQKLPDWLIACTAKNNGELRLKQLLTGSQHDLVDMAGQSPEAFKDDLESKTGLTLEEIKEFMTSEEFLIPIYIVSAKSGKGLGTEVGYTHAFPHLLHLMSENKNSSISENLFRSMCPNPMLTMRPLVAKYIRQPHKDESTYVESYFQGEGTHTSFWAGHFCFMGNLMTWAIGTGSDYVLDVVCDSGYRLDVRDVLSAPRANRYAWNKVREKFNMSDEAALEKIKEYLSERDNSRDRPPELNDGHLAAIELFIETSIDIANKNKAISQEERDQIKEMVAENGDKISRNTQLIQALCAGGTAFIGIYGYFSLRNLEKNQKDLKEQLLRKPLLPREDDMELATRENGMELTTRENGNGLAETFGKPAG